MPDSRGVSVPPMDEHNALLVSRVHPPGWVNPRPQAKYNLVVIGAGAGGLITSIVAASLGAKVALVERHLLGGDCLNVGCVPSKCVIASSRAAAAFRAAARFGIAPREPETDFAAVMARMRRLRAEISAVDAAQRYRDAGVDVFLGEGRFTGRDTVEVNGAVLRFRKAVIATGARAAALPIAGLEDAGCLTNETVFTLTERPARLAIIGAGPIGCELAQAFQRLGSQVTLLEALPRILGREDEEAAALVHARMAAEGVDIRTGCAIAGVSAANGIKTIHLTRNGIEERVDADEILLGVGRAPNVEGLGLEAAGVDYDTRGVTVNDFLETSNRDIYAVGDVCLPWKFTHAADVSAQIAIQNALFSIGPLGRRRVSRVILPWCTYTDPEIAHVGLYPHEARERGIEIDTYVQPLSEVDRAIADSDTEGFVKIHARKGTDKIVGATVVAAHAGDLISEITIAMANGLGMNAIASAIHPYPTQAEAIKKAASQYRKSKLKPSTQRWLKRWMDFRR